MKGNVFSKWLQEFCSLVFVQTIQAFILAMIMTIVISAMNAGGNSDSSEVLYSTGILAIVALTSISKIEELVKNIFGLQGGLGDKANMKNGAGALVGTMMAARFAKRFLDNGQKMASGVKGVFDANTQRRVNRANWDKSTSAANQKYDDNVKELDDKFTQEYGNRSTWDIQTKQRYEDKIEKLKDKRDSTLTSANKAYQEGEKAASKNFKTSTQKFTSGATEGLLGTGGAVLGATGSLIYHGASGEVKASHVLNSALTGMGAGDALGEAINNTAYTHIVKTQLERSEKLAEKQSKRDYNRNRKAIDAALKKINDVDNI